MIVWGGSDPSSELSSGGHYNPASNSWTSTMSVSCGRELHTALWNGTSMVIAGGRGDTNQGGDQPFPSGECDAAATSYTPNSGWTNLSTSSQPSPRFNHTAVFDGTDMLVFGGYDNSSYQSSGSKFLFSQSAWLAFAGTPPDGRSQHSAVWVESVGTMVVWGGRNSNGLLATGAEYVSAQNNWGPSVPTILDGRVEHTAISTADQMIVWGGSTNNGRVNTGGIYTP
jgi:hypothetical protein